MTKWKGTMVPNTGYIDKFYLNINLPKEEVTEILKRLSYTNKNNILLVCPVTEANSLAIAAVKYSNDDYGIVASPDTLLFESTHGWLITESEIPTLAIGDAVTNLSGYNVGYENYKITSLFSSTPFVKDPAPKYQGTIVPNVGAVDKVYLNTNLSIPEVYEMLAELDYPIEQANGSIVGTGQSWIYFMMTGEVWVFALKDISTQYGTQYGIMTMGSEENAILFTPADIGYGWSGWNPKLLEVGGEFSTEGSVLVEDDGNFVGLQNDKLSSLFSVTPFRLTHDPILRIRKSTLEDIANAVRDKNGSSDLIAINNLDDAVKSLSGAPASVGALWGLQLPTPYENATYNMDEVVSIVRNVFQDLVDHGSTLYHLQHTIVGDNVKLEFVKVDNIENLPVQTLQIDSSRFILVGVTNDLIELIMSTLEVDRDSAILGILTGAFGEALQTIKLIPPQEIYSRTVDIPVYNTDGTTSSTNNITYGVLVTKDGWTTADGIIVQTAPSVKASVVNNFW